jgi:hypothetical protein
MIPCGALKMMVLDDSQEMDTAGAKFINWLLFLEV